MKTYRLIYVTVAVKVEPNADVHEVTSDMDYNFDHPDVIGTEIVSVHDNATIEEGIEE